MNVLTALMAGLVLAAPPFQEIRTATYHGVVVPAKAKAHMGLTKLGGRKLDGKFWTPSGKEVARFEAGVTAFLKASKASREAKLHERVAKYKRQWVGLSAEGRRFVYGNFLCRAHDGWKQRVVMVDDGGDCYFQVAFDLTDGKYTNLMINGDG